MVLIILVFIFLYLGLSLSCFRLVAPPPKLNKVRGRFQLPGPAGSDGPVRNLLEPVRSPDGSAGAALGHGRASRGSSTEARAAGGMS